MGRNMQNIHMFCIRVLQRTTKMTMHACRNWWGVNVDRRELLEWWDSKLDYIHALIQWGGWEFSFLRELLHHLTFSSHPPSSLSYPLIRNVFQLYQVTYIVVMIVKVVCLTCTKYFCSNKLQIFYSACVSLFGMWASKLVYSQGEERDKTLI